MWHALCRIKSPGARVYRMMSPRRTGASILESKTASLLCTRNGVMLPPVTTRGTVSPALSRSRHCAKNVSVSIIRFICAPLCRYNTPSKRAMNISPLSRRYAAFRQAPPASFPNQVHKRPFRGFGRIYMRPLRGLHESEGRQDPS